MNTKLIWMLFLPLFLFFLVMFYLEVSLYSVLPPHQGGMSFWMEIKHTWYRSIWFYAMVLISCLLFYVSYQSVNRSKNSF